VCQIYLPTVKSCLTRNIIPPGTTDQCHARNPYFTYYPPELAKNFRLPLGFPAFFFFLKPYSGGGGKHVPPTVAFTRLSFFAIIFYNQTPATLCHDIVKSTGVEFSRNTFVATWVGQENVHIMH